MEQILNNKEILFFCLGFITAIVLILSFKNIIIQYVKKQYTLYNIDEIYKAGKRIYGGILTQDVIEELKINRENGTSR